MQVHKRDRKVKFITNIYEAIICENIYITTIWEEA